jgi:hypothetical protein
MYPAGYTIWARHAGNIIGFILHTNNNVLNASIEKKMKQNKFDSVNNCIYVFYFKL